MASNPISSGTLQIGDQVFQASDISIEYGLEKFVDDYPPYPKSYKMLPLASSTISFTVEGDAPAIGSRIKTMPLSVPERPVVKSPAYPETGRRRLCLEEE